MTQKDPPSLYRASARQAIHDLGGTTHDGKGPVFALTGYAAASPVFALRASIFVKASEDKQGSRFTVQSFSPDYESAFTEIDLDISSAFPYPILDNRPVFPS